MRRFVLSFRKEKTVEDRYVQFAHPLIPSLTTGGETKITATNWDGEMSIITWFICTKVLRLMKNAARNNFIA